MFPKAFEKSRPGVFEVNLAEVPADIPVCQINHESINEVGFITTNLGVADKLCATVCGEAPLPV